MPKRNIGHALETGTTDLGRDILKGAEDFQIEAMVHNLQDIIPHLDDTTNDETYILKSATWRHLLKNKYSSKNVEECEEVIKNCLDIKKQEYQGKTYIYQIEKSGYHAERWWSEYIGSDESYDDVRRLYHGYTLVIRGAIYSTPFDIASLNKYSITYYQTYDLDIGGEKVHFGNLEDNISIDCDIKKPIYQFLKERLIEANPWLKSDIEDAEEEISDQ